MDKYTVKFINIHKEQIENLVDELLTERISFTFEPSSNDDSKFEIGVPLDHIGRAMAIFLASAIAEALKIPKG